MDKTKKKNDVESAILKLVDEVSPFVGQLILEEYNKIPFTIKNAVAAFQEAISNVANPDSLDNIKETLEKLRLACEANPDYKDVYETAEQEAKTQLAEVIGEEASKMLDEDD